MEHRPSSRAAVVQTVSELERPPLPEQSSGRAFDGCPGVFSGSAGAPRNAFLVREHRGARASRAAFRNRDLSR
eukprot:597671-Alexandrium_andersonii.AAC.1